MKVFKNYSKVFFVRIETRSLISILSRFPISFLSPEKNFFEKNLILNFFIPGKGISSDLSHVERLSCLETCPGCFNGGGGLAQVVDSQTSAMAVASSKPLSFFDVSFFFSLLSSRKNCLYWAEKVKSLSPGSRRVKKF